MIVSTSRGTAAPRSIVASSFATRSKSYNSSAPIGAKENPNRYPTILLFSSLICTSSFVDHARSQNLLNKWRACADCPDAVLNSCLLYTSDAADDLLCVDLG